MKHRKVGRKIGAHSAQSWATLRTMVSQLVMHERIETTLPKAKELRRLADHVVTLGKEGTLHARQKTTAIVRTKDVMHKLFTTMAARYRERNGGYCRILRTRIRPDDCAQMAYIEYVDRPGELRPARRPPAKDASFLPFAAQSALQ